MDTTPTLPREPPRLYSPPFISIALGIHISSATNAIGKLRMRTFGMYHMPAKGGGIAYCCTAVQVSQWLVGGRRHWAVTPAAIECWFDGLIYALRECKKLPRSQRYLEDTPYDDLVWMSDYAHHGGRTQEKTNGT